MPRSTLEIDAEREQAVKDALDAVAYPLGFFRDCDEPNEIFASRLIRYIEHQIAAQHGHAKNIADLVRRPSRNGSAVVLAELL